MKKNLLILGILVATLVIAFFAYSYIKNATSGKTVITKRAGISNAVSEEKTVNMQGHWKGEDLREDFITETVKEFETRNPGVAVNIKWNLDFPDGREGALQETINQFKTGVIDWDVIWLEPFYYQKIANSLGDQDWAQHFLVDFESIPGFKETQKSFILSDPQYRDSMNGIISGPYIEGFYQPFFYNKELADKIGLKIKETGMTFDDLLGYFKQIDEYNKQNGTNIPILYDSGDYKGGIGYAPSTWNIFQSLFRSEFSSLAEVKNLEPSEKKMVAVKKALNSLQELSQYKPLISGWENLPWFETRYYVLENKAVFTACGASWMYSHWHGIDAKKTIKMIPVEMPMYQPTDHYMGGYNPMFAVAKDSPVRDEAIKLLMTFSTSDTAEKWVKYAKAPSGIKGNLSTAGDASGKTDQFDNFITYISNKYAGNVFDSKTVDYVLGKKYKDFTLQFSKYLGAVMDGKITADEAYEKIISDMKTIDSR